MENAKFAGQAMRRGAPGFSLWVLRGIGGIDVFVFHTPGLRYAGDVRADSIGQFDTRFCHSSARVDTGFYVVFSADPRQLERQLSPRREFALAGRAATLGPAMTCVHRGKTRPTKRVQPRASARFVARVRRAP
jgi:hypothetical protein